MPAVESTQVEKAPELSDAQILRFYFPLALSWIFMAVESPVAVSVISRLPDAQVNTAAYFPLMSLALWIESPVIDLLATSTTLARNRRHYAALTRFTGWLMAWVTLAHAAIVFTPLYDLLADQVLRLPPEVSHSTRLGLSIMLLWSACIGWRRYLQGVMIRNGHTRMIGLGTAVRVTTMILTAYGLFFLAKMPSIAIVGTALMASVAAEAAFIHWASRSVIRETFEIDHDGEPQGAGISTAELAKFHLPLTATTMVMMASFPITAAALDRTSNPIPMLASWQVATSLMFLMRTIVFALPEVVITLAKDSVSAQTLRDFCFKVGMFASLVLLFLGSFNLDTLFFIHVLGAERKIAESAHIGFLAGALTPFIGALQSYVRGMLTAHHLTAARLWSILVNVAVLVAMLWFGLWRDWLGVVNAAVAMTVAMIVELATLVWFWKRAKPGLPSIHEQADSLSVP